MCVGGKVSAVLFCLEMTVPFVWIIAGIIFGYFPYWSALSLVAVVPAVKNAMQAFRYNKEGMAALVGVDENTAKLQLAFSVLMFVSLVTAVMW